MRLALKSGNFGGQDFFEKAFAMMGGIVGLVSRAALVRQGIVRRRPEQTKRDTGRSGRKVAPRLRLCARVMKRACVSRRIMYSLALFQFLAIGEYGRFQAVARDDGPVIGEQDRRVSALQRTDGVRHRRIARPEVRHKRRRAAAHELVGRQRRQRATWIEAGQHAQRHAMRGMQMHDLLAGLVSYTAECRGFFRRPVAVDMPPVASTRDSRAGSRKPTRALVGVASQPPSSSRTEILPDEPGVSPRSNSERAKAADLFANVLRSCRRSVSISRNVVMPWLCRPSITPLNTRPTPIADTKETHDAGSGVDPHLSENTREPVGVRQAQIGSQHGGDDRARYGDERRDLGRRGLDRCGHAENVASRRVRNISGMASGTKAMASRLSLSALPRPPPDGDGENS